MLGWFGAYLFISIVAARLPDGVECAVTIFALWGLVFLCAGRFEDKKSISEKLSHGGIRLVRVEVILLTFCAGAGLNLAFGGLLPLLPLPEEILKSYIEASAQYEDPDKALMVEAVFLAPILEETVFRGLISDRLGRVIPKWLVLPIASVIFAVMHGDPLWISYAFISGLILTWMYFRCKSILPCISFHIAFNAANYLWEMILPLPDEIWAYAVSLGVGIVLIIASLALTLRQTKE